MGNIGEAMTNPTIPPVGTAGTGYATTVNEFLTEVKQRLEDKVPLSSILIEALDMTNNPILGVEYLGLYDQGAAPTSPSGSIQNYGGDLYWVSPSGAVQLTSDNTLNSGGIGGIGGDYGGVNPAQFRFVDADKTFYAYDDFGGDTWARIFARSYDITGDDNGSQRVRLSWAGSASYTITLPATAPASQQIVQMDESGDVTVSNTLISDLTLASGKNLVVSGTGKLVHGDRVRTFPWQNSTQAVPNGSVAYLGIGGFDVGTKITAISFVHFKGSTGVSEMRVYSSPGGSPAPITATVTSNTAGWQTTDIPITSSPYTIAAGTTFELIYAPPASGGGTDTIRNINITYHTEA